MGSAEQISRQRCQRAGLHRQNRLSEAILMAHRSGAFPGAFSHASLHVPFRL